jgi:hypothetical protein
MFLSAKHAGSFARVGAANFLQFWQAQLNVWQRCIAMSAHAAAAWHKHTLRHWNDFSAGKNGDEPMRPVDADALMENLIQCWLETYNAGVLLECIREVESQLAEAIDTRVKEFDSGLAVTRAADEASHIPHRQNRAVNRDPPDSGRFSYESP